MNGQYCSRQAGLRMGYRGGILVPAFVRVMSIDLAVTVSYVF